MRTTNYVRHFLAAILLASMLVSSAAPPDVTNVRAAQRSGTHLVDIYYNLAAIGPCTIYVAVSDNGGTTYNVPVFTMSGAVGPGVSPGVNRLATWNAATDWPGRFSDQCRVRVTADDGTAPPAPAGMVYIPAGTYQMGDSFMTDGGTTELPVHNVHVSAFFMDKFEVKRELWLDVHAWALGQGYSLYVGGSYGAGHPIHSVSWHDAIKWCNARSEKEGLTPCYYTDPSQAIVYRSDILPITNACVKWNANGYRLPTEAEWEKAARGGLNARRFPWGDTIAHSQATYNSIASYAYDVSTTRGAHNVYGTSTSPAGFFSPNGYGLYDMAGNLFEWVWDRYDATYYGQSAATQDNPRGPANDLTYRILRGGAWGYGASFARCADRSYGINSAGIVNQVGFRCVRGF